MFDLEFILFLLLTKQRIVKRLHEVSGLGEADFRFFFDDRRDSK